MWTLEARWTFHPRPCKCGKQNLHGKEDDAIVKNGDHLLSFSSEEEAKAFLDEESKLDTKCPTCGEALCVPTSIWRAVEEK